MITKEQAITALDVLLYKNDASITDAYYVVREFINQAPDTPAPDVKILYEYKLRRADGKYLDKSNWTEKGKTYKNRNALSTAIGQFIGERIDNHPDKPTYDKFTTVVEEYGIIVKRYDQEGFKKAYREWWKKREDKNIRALYIPTDWIVIAIPVNANVPIVEHSAIDWYKGAKP